ncbi:MAG: LysR family transcriptional regulator [Rubrivivax sp.]
MDLDQLRLLRAFTVLLAERSVTRAAVRLDLSQPATSHALARLRALFGDPLLMRSAKGLVPTPRALDLEPEVARLVADYDRLVHAGQAFDPATAARTFVITAPEFGERLLVPHLFRTLRAQAPGVRVEVRAPNPDRALEMLESGEIDLRVAWLTRPSPSLRSMPLYQDRLVCIACARHPRVQGRLSLSQFLELPHVRTIGTSHATTIRVIDETLQRSGLRLERSFLVQNFMTIPSTLEGTDLLATLPAIQGRAFAREFALQVLEPPLRLPRIRYGAYWHERSQKDAGHRWLRRMVQEAAAAFAGQTGS